MTTIILALITINKANKSHMVVIVLQTKIDLSDHLVQSLYITNEDKDKRGYTAYLKSGCWSPFNTYHTIFILYLSFFL